FMYDKAQLFRQQTGKVVQCIQFALQALERSLLRAGKVLQAADQDKGMVGAAADDLDDLLLFQPELTAAGQTQQHMNGDAVACGQLAEQRKLADRLDREQARAVFLRDHAFNIRRGFVYAGDHLLFGVYKTPSDIERM